MLKFMVDEKFLSENMIDNLIGMANEQKDVERVSLFIDAKEELYPGSEKFDRMLKNMDADIKKQERKKKDSAKYPTHRYMCAGTETKSITTRQHGEANGHQTEAVF